jgi:hypothetical protein
MRTFTEPLPGLAHVEGRPANAHECLANAIHEQT